MAGLALGRADRVLDIGCGAGDFSRIVADLVPAGVVLGVDPSASLLQQAAAVAGPNQAFAQLRAQDLGQRVEHCAAPSDGQAGGPGFGLGEGSFDVVLSRAALHWVPARDHPALLAAAYRLLRPCGVLRLEFGGAGNIREALPWLNAISARHGGPVDPWNFQGAGDYLVLLENAGFVLEPIGWVRLDAQRRAFTREALAGVVASQFLQAFDVHLAPPAAAAFRSEALKSIDDLRRADGTYDQTFVRLDVNVRKPGRVAGK